MHMAFFPVFHFGNPTTKFIEIDEKKKRKVIFVQDTHDKKEEREGRERRRKGEGRRRK